MSRYAAVAIIASRRDEVLFIRRRENPSDPWSGDIAFPGGRVRGEDIDLLDTVYREVYEEVGIDLNRYVTAPLTLGVFHPLSFPDLKVYSFVFWVDGRPETTRGGEVSEIHWIPITRLSRDRCRRFIRARGVERIVECFRAGDIVIWGMTYRILNKFLSEYYPLNIDG